jgi:hypothetical protein
MTAIFFVALLAVSMFMTLTSQADISIPIYTNPDFMRANCVEELQQGRGAKAVCCRHGLISPR